MEFVSFEQRRLEGFRSKKTIKLIKIFKKANNFRLKKRKGKIVDMPLTSFKLYKL